MAAKVEVTADIGGLKTVVEEYVKKLQQMENSTVVFGQALTRINAEGKETSTVIEGLSDSGQKLTITLQEIEEKVKVTSAQIENASKAFASLKDNLKSTAEAQSAVSTLFSTFDPKNLNPTQIITYQNAIGKIISLFQEGKIDVAQFNLILANLQKDPLAALKLIEEGERKVARAISDVIKVTEQATQAQQAKNTASTKAASNAKDAADAERLIRSNISTAGFNVNQLNAFDASIQKIKQSIESGRITYQRFVEFVNQLKVNPKAILQGDVFTAEEAKVVAALRNLNDGFSRSKGAGASLGESLISLVGVLRIVESIAIKRFTFSLISELRNSLTSAKDFSVKVAEITTLSDAAGVSAERWGNGISQLSNAFGNTKVDVAEAAYQTLSNQIAKGTDALKFQKTALDFSKATVSSAADSTNLLSSALNSFRISSSEATRVADVLFTTIDIGRLRAKDIADTFGRVGIPARGLGVSLEEVAAALATLTKQGITPAESMTLLSGLMIRLQKPTEEVKNLFNQLGFSSVTAAIATKGFSGVLKLLEDESRKQVGSSNELLVSLRDIKTELGLTGPVFRDFENALKQITDAQGKASEAANKVKESLGEQYTKQITQLKNKFEEAFGANALFTIVKFGNFVGGEEGLAGGFSKLAHAITLAAASAGALVIATKAIGAAVSTGGFIVLAGIATVAYVAMDKLLERIRLTSNALDDLKAKYAAGQKERDAVEKKSVDTQTENVNKLANSTKEQYSKKYGIILDYSTGVIRLSNSVRDIVIEDTKRTTDHLKESTKIITHDIQRNINELSSSATRAETQIRTSLKVSEDLPKKASDSLFQEKFKNAYSGDVGPNLLDSVFPNQKIPLIESRIKQLTKLARDEAAKNTDESITESRRYYDEVEKLEIQKFELVNNRNRAQFEARVAAGQETPTGFDSQGRARYLYITQTAEVERTINKLTKERLAIEEQIRSNQTELKKEKLAQADAEKRRQVQIDQALREAIEVQSKIYNNKGDIQPEFLKNPQALTEKFDRIKKVLTSNLNPDEIIKYRDVFRDLENQRIAAVKEANTVINTLRAEAAQKEILGQKTRTEELIKSSGDLKKSAISEISRYSEFINQFVNTTGKAYTSNGYLIAAFNDLQKAFKEFSNIKTPENLQKVQEAFNKIKEKVSKPTEESSEFIRVGIAIDQIKKQLVNREAADNTLDILSKSATIFNEKIAKANEELTKFGATSISAKEIISSEFEAIRNDTDLLIKKLMEAQAALQGIGGNKIPQIQPVNPNPEAAIPGGFFGGSMDRYYTFGGMSRFKRKRHYDDGGWIGARPRGSDSNLIYAANGEHITNARSAAQFAPLLEAINNNRLTGPGSSRTVNNNVGGIHISVQGGDSSDTTIRNIAQGLRRELRRGTITLD